MRRFANIQQGPCRPVAFIRHALNNSGIHLSSLQLVCGPRNDAYASVVMVPGFVFYRSEVTANWARAGVEPVIISPFIPARASWWLRKSMSLQHVRVALPPTASPLRIWFRVCRDTTNLVEQSISKTLGIDLMVNRSASSSLPTLGRRVADSCSREELFCQTMVVSRGCLAHACSPPVKLCGSFYCWGSF